jgi:hypothetical protein
MNIAGAGGGAAAGPVLALAGYAGLAAGAGVLVAIVVVAALLVSRRPAVYEPADRAGDRTGATR